MFSFAIVVELNFSWSYFGFATAAVLLVALAEFLVITVAIVSVILLVIMVQALIIVVMSNIFW